MPRTREITRHTFDVARFRVSVVSGTDIGRAGVSHGVEFTLGTAEGNDLVLTDPSVSRHHFVLGVTPTGVELRDLDSTNGTTLGGYRVTSGVLEAGALIGAGETKLRFEILPEHVGEPVSREDRFGPVLGRSVAMRRLFAILERVAPSDASILLEGETGTGKGLLAEAIHDASSRRGGPFVVIDCAAMPPQLMEAELFGHEAGAFSGAQRERTGLFESAAGGTIFLDEIGELPFELQPKLLRVLEKREVRPVGSNEQRPVDVRIVAATNRDLRREVNRGSFRSDLWYRLNTVRLVVPPLRERREDIPLLVSHFYRQMSRDGSSAPPAELVSAVLGARLDGNVRELATAVERSLVFDDPQAWQAAIRADTIDDPWSYDPERSFRAAKMRATGQWERAYLIQLIGHHSGNISAAARAARMDRSHLRTLLRKHDIEIPGRDTDIDIKLPH